MRLSGHDIVCLSAVDWDHPSGSNRHPLMGQLAEMNRVLFVDAPATALRALFGLSDPRYQAKWGAWLLKQGPRRLAHNLYVWTPPCNWLSDQWFDPWHLRHALQRTCRRLGFESPILWLDPELASSEAVIGALNECLVIAHAGSSSREPSSRGTRVLKRSDLCFINHPSQRLVRQALWMPDGIDFESFNRAVYPDTPIPHDVRTLSKPIVGYFGEVDETFDFKLWEYAALKRPTWSFVAVGPVAAGYAERVEQARRQPNVRFLGPRTPETLPSYLKAVRVVARPWKAGKSPAHALGLFECFAAGKGVVTTDPRESEEGVIRASGRSEFLRALSSDIEAAGARRAFEQIQRAQAHTWEARCRGMEAAILERLAMKAKPSAIPLLVERIVRQGI